MAETIKPVPTTAAPPPAPEPVPAAPLRPSTEPAGKVKKLNKVLAKVNWFVCGLGFLFLAVEMRVRDFVPPLFRPLRDHWVPHLPYLVAAIGLFCLGHTRSLVLMDFVKQNRFNRQSPHSWKIPLIGTQVFIVQAVAFYAFLVGVQAIRPVHNLMWLTLFVAALLIYILWYLIAFATNRMPSYAGLLIALMAVVMAAASFESWVVLQWVFVSLVAALFAVIAAISSLTLTVSIKTQQKGSWPKLACLTAVVVLLIPVGRHSLLFGKPRTDLVGLGLAAKGIQGEVSAMAYSVDGRKIAFCQKVKQGYFLQVVNPERTDSVIIKVPAGEAPFRPFFVEGGRTVLLDAMNGEARQLWKVDVASGSVTALKGVVVEPFEDGSHWSEKNSQFLYVSNEKGKYRLNSLSLPGGKSKLLLSSDAPIHTPSWGYSLDEIVFADGTKGLPYSLDLPSRTVRPIVSEEDKDQAPKWLEGPPVVGVIPSPDGFRYLYVTRSGRATAIWEVLADGTKRSQLYGTEGAVSDVSWLPNGQKILFEEKKQRNDFLAVTQNVQVLDANTGAIESLLPTQFSSGNPAAAPDGVKIAFTGSQGMWYPTPRYLGIWVAVLR